MGRNFRVFLLIFLTVISCAKKGEVKHWSDAGSQFKAAKTYFDKGDYEKARTLFEDLLFRYPTSVFADDAQFYLAECYLRSKNYDEAISEFTFFLTNFPKSEYVKRAMLDLARAHYLKAGHPELDQTETQEAIRILRNFLNKYKNCEETEEARELLQMAKERLATKMLKTAQLYWIMGKTKSARLYLDLLFTEYPDSKAAKEGHLLLAEIEFKEGNTDTACLLVDEVLSDSTLPHDLISKASKLKETIRKKSQK